MNKLISPILVSFLASYIGIAFGQVDDGSDALDDLARARALLSEQQDRFGAMDARLIEPIEQLADQLIALNQFQEAHGLLDRAIQITRVEGGLYTELQRPLLSKKVNNLANRGEWDNARDNMEHLFWLYAEKSTHLDQDLVEDLLQLSRLHLRGLAEDSSARQGYHFRRSAQIRWIALGVAKSLWGETDERLAPIVYEQLRQLHLQTAALWRGGGTSYALRQVAPGSSIMQDRSDVDELFYVTGLGLLNDLHGIYAQGEAVNPEGIAMSNVYLADWHILYGRAELAMETYRQAYQELLAVGIESQLLDEFFAQPLVIPDTGFYADVEAAVVAQRNKIVTENNGNNASYLSFNEWSAAMPNVRNPLASQIPEEQDRDSNFALFSFSLAGVNKVSRWYSHRFVSTINMIEQAELLSHYLDSPSEDEELVLLDKLNRLTFRPKLVGGEPQQVSGRLKYHLAEGSWQSF